MARFRDVYAPDTMASYPCYSGPRWHTNIVIVASGESDADQKWEMPLYKITMPECIRGFRVTQDVGRHWLIMNGPAHTWPFRDPTDFASVDLEEFNVAPDLSGDDQLLGFGDGDTTQFQLIKTYELGGFSLVRNLYLPVVQSLIVTIDGEETEAFSVSRPGGVITFDEAPLPSTEIRWGGLFDLEVRYERDDTFEAIFQKPGAGGYAEIVLTEERPCTEDD